MRNSHHITMHQYWANCTERSLSRVGPVTNLRFTFAPMLSVGLISHLSKSSLHMTVLLLSTVGKSSSICPSSTWPKSSTATSAQITSTAPTFDAKSSSSNSTIDTIHAILG